MKKTKTLNGHAHKMQQLKKAAFIRAFCKDEIRAMPPGSPRLTGDGTMNGSSVTRIPQDGPTKVGLDDFLVAGGNVEELETRGLDSRAFKSERWWFGKWKLTRAMEAA